MDSYSYNGKYSAHYPYPFIDEAKRDRKTALKLFEIRSRILDLISEYCYRSIVFSAYYPRMSTVFDGISTNNMLHYRILSELIEKLGANPTENARVHNIPVEISEDKSDLVPKKANAALRSFLHEEECIIKLYSMLKTNTADNVVVSVLDRLCEDCKCHVNILAEYSEHMSLS